MKKLDFIKYAAILAAFFVVLFVAGCGDNVNTDIDGNGNPDDNSGNNPGSITIPTEPPSVSGGSLTKTGGEPVTRANLNDFIEAVSSALDKYYRPRGTRALPDEYDIEISYYKGSYITYGNYSGRVEITSEESAEYEWSGATDKGGETEYVIATYKYFDFSNHDSLFLGGAIGYLETEVPLETEEPNVTYTTSKANGKINFAGKYRGAVFFDNVAIKTKRIENFGPEEYEYELESGRFYVKSEGQEPIDLPYSLLLLRGFTELYTDRTDYGDEPITITMPAVPSVTGGILNNRSGNNYQVDNNNLSVFFSAFKEELKGGALRSAVFETRESEYILEHGRASGYFTSKDDGIGQVNNSGLYVSSLQTLKFDDYSNKGVLYFGGGYGLASFTHFHYPGSQSSGHTIEYILNGKVKFNGEFKGELDFQNFRYKYEYIGGGGGIESIYRYTHVSGSVKIGTLDVTEEYLEEIIKENW